MKLKQLFCRHGGCKWLDHVGYVKKYDLNENLLYLGYILKCAKCKREIIAECDSQMLREEIRRESKNKLDNNSELF